jgi:hypothetical protein
MTMSNQQAEWVEILRNTLRYRQAVEEAAGEFTALSSDDYENLAQHLVDSGEDKALGILLRICTINGVKLDPNLLAETIKVVEPLDDFGIPYCLQNETAITPLLKVAQAEDISWERQAYVGILAAELAVRFDRDHQAVKRVLLKLSNKIRSPLDQYLVDQGLALLEKPPQDEKEVQYETLRDPFDRLPEEKPPIVAKALRASAAFAAHDESVWRKTVTIKRLPKIYRIRLSVDHRLMIRWQPDDLLQILEIIPRSQLETWIRQHAR